MDNTIIVELGDDLRGLVFTQHIQFITEENHGLCIAHFKSGKELKICAEFDEIINLVNTTKE